MNQNKKRAYNRAYNNSPNLGAFLIKVGATRQNIEYWGNKNKHYFDKQEVTE